MKFLGETSLQYMSFKDSLFMQCFNLHLYLYFIPGMYFGVRWKEPRLKNYDNTTM